MDETAETSEPKSSLFYLPYILGGVGILFLLVGAYLTINKTTEKPKITITDSSLLSNPTNLSNPSSKIIVDVSGAVEKPGVYELPENSRFQNALVLAGGLSEEADRDYVDKYINLASKLTDGTKIYIPKLNEQNTETQNSNLKTQNVLGINSLININTASLSELDTLSGVGPVTGQKIVDGRPYSKIEELLEKKIVGNSVWEKIKEKISVY